MVASNLPARKRTVVKPFNIALPETKQRSRKELQAKKREARAQFKKEVKAIVDRWQENRAKAKNSPKKSAGKKRKVSDKKKATKKAAKKTAAKKTAANRKPTADKKRKEPEADTEMEPAAEEPAAEESAADNAKPERPVRVLQVTSTGGRRGTGYKWQFVENDKTWRDYTVDASAVVEQHYGEWNEDNHNSHLVRAVKSGDWCYKVDFIKMEQTNVDHSSHTVRRIRRTPLGTEPGEPVR